MFFIYLFSFRGLEWSRTLSSLEKRWRLQAHYRDPQALPQRTVAKRLRILRSSSRALDKKHVIKHRTLRTGMTSKSDTWDGMSFDITEWGSRIHFIGNQREHLLFLQSLRRPASRRRSLRRDDRGTSPSPAKSARSRPCCLYRAERTVITIRRKCNQRREPWATESFHFAPIHRTR